MKKTEQIETAKEIIENLQDYIELAKVEKRLKTENPKHDVSKTIDNIVEYVNNASKEI